MLKSSAWITRQSTEKRDNPLPPPRPPSTHLCLLSMATPFSLPPAVYKIHNGICEAFTALYVTDPDEDDDKITSHNARDDSRPAGPLHDVVRHH